MSALKDEIRIELNKAYERFGWEKNDLDHNVEKIMNQLVDGLIEKVNIGKNLTLVVPVAVAKVDFATREIVSRDNKSYTRSKMTVIDLTVSDSGVSFVKETSDCYEPDRWDGDEIFENIEYEKVNIENVDGKFFPIAI